MTRKQARSYFNQHARSQTRGPRAPYYYIYTPDGRFLSDADLRGLWKKFDAAVDDASQPETTEQQIERSM